MISWVDIEAALGEQGRQHAVRGRLAGVQRLAHGAAVLLHAAGLGRGNPHRVGQPLRVEIEQLAAGDARRDRAERAGEMPAALVMAGRGAARAHAGLEAGRIGQHELLAADGRALGQREQRGEHRRARMQHHAAHVGVVVVQHMAHLAVGERRIEQSEFELASEHGCGRLAGGFLQHARASVVMVRWPEPASAQPIQSSTPRRASRFAAADRSPNRVAARWPHSVLVSVTASVLRF